MKFIMFFCLSLYSIQVDTKEILEQYIDDMRLELLYRFHYMKSDDRIQYNIEINDVYDYTRTYYFIIPRQIEHDVMYKHINDVTKKLNDRNKESMFYRHHLDKYYEYENTLTYHLHNAFLAVLLSAICIGAPVALQHYFKSLVIYDVYMMCCGVTVCTFLLTCMTYKYMIENTDYKTTACYILTVGTGMLFVSILLFVDK